MANPHKGELAFTAGEQSYMLRFSANAICELEAQLDCAVMDVIPKLNRPRWSLVRTVLWAGLTEHHAAITLKQAGDIMDALGGIAETMAKISKALSLSFPDASEGAETKGEDPPSGAGTGPGSTQAG